LAKGDRIREGSLHDHESRRSETRFRLSRSNEESSGFDPNQYIAEGFERSSRKEYLLFLNIAKGSAGETRSLLRVALEVGYFTEAQHDRLRQNAITLSKYLFNQMNSIRNAPPQQLK
jgi:hypothetical protein